MREIDILDWREKAARCTSLGSVARRPGSLAGLHAARREHQGQFFTPAPLAGWLWRMLAPSLSRDSSEPRVSVLDNSCGNGALLRFADPLRHVIAGIDVDRDSVAALSEDAESAGFDCEFSSVGMEQCHPRGYDLAVINPPFSLTLQGPTLTPGFATVYGRFGPDTSALSHAYALQQALDAAAVVGAILPRSYADRLVADAADWPRLVACFHAPGHSFREEGTLVSVSVCFFNRDPRPAGLPVQLARIDDDYHITPALRLSARARHDSPRLRVIGIKDSGPTIMRPVTGDRVVRVGHSGRKIVLGFGCGLQEAKTLNAILCSRLVPTGIEGHRYPKDVRYVGEGVLDIEVHLVQPDPLASFDAFLASLKDTGAIVDVDPGLWGYLRKRQRQLKVASTPFRHTVLIKEGMVEVGSDDASLQAHARATHCVNPGVWGSPVIAAGEEVSFTRDGPLWRCTVKGYQCELSEDELHQRFAVASTPAGDRWVTVHDGRLAAFPQRAAALRQRAVELGLDRFLSWDYQLEDLLELAMNRGGIAAWAVGLGKARLAVSLVLLSGCSAGLICTEAYLLEELCVELRKLGIDEGLWQIIDKPEKLSSLRRINLISYNRLRAPIGRGAGRRTYARLLRRRIGTLVADEGDLLRNKASQQTRALWQLAAKRRYILSGTPLGNYPRDAFSLLAFAGGDATAAQVYGMRRFLLDPALRHSMFAAVPGVDAVRDRFVTLEWVTNEFADDLTTGAKREVPKLRNLPIYRNALAPFVKRRVAAEPDVQKHFQVPVPRRVTSEIGWDDAHLAHYLAVCEDFRQWFLAGEASSKSRNLVALLARIQAVQIAAAVPQRSGVSSPFQYNGGLTSKQRFAVDRLTALTQAGHKSIAYAEYPDMLELISAGLNERGIENVVLHGRIPVAQRIRALNERFRFGPAPVLLASLGVVQKGLNIWQADRVMFLTRSWTAKTEGQAEGRVLRPQQKRSVVTEFLELSGSIDKYQAQMVAHKSDAINAGLDWGTPELADVDFLHLDTMLGRFVEDLAILMQCRPHELRSKLAA